MPSTKAVIRSHKCLADYILIFLLFLCHTKSTGCHKLQVFYFPVNAPGCFHKLSDSLHVAWPAWSSGACLGLVGGMGPSTPMVMLRVTPLLPQGILCSLLSLLQILEVCRPHGTVSNYFCGPTLTSLPLWLILFLCLYIPALFSHFVATSSFFVLTSAPQIIIAVVHSKASFFCVFTFCLCFCFLDCFHCFLTLPSCLLLFESLLNGWLYVWTLKYIEWYLNSKNNKKLWGQ